MASAFGGATKPAVRGGVRDEVYVAAVALRATKGPAQLLMSAAYSLNLWDLQHFMVVIRPSSPPQSKAIVFDFQPRDPENVYVALAALAGNKVPGDVLVRKLSKLPKSKCWFVGTSDIGAVDATSEFNRNWDTQLQIGSHDCRHYTNGLVECLTGERCVLDRIQKKARRDL